MKYLLPLLAAFAAPSLASAQDLGALSFGFGLGAQYKPSYPGSDEMKASPWIIFRGGEGEGADGFSIRPSARLLGARDESSDPSLAGMGDIDRAVELGGRLSWTTGPLTAFGSVRRGFGGHEGIAGETGLRYRIEAAPNLTLWAGIEAGYGNASFNQTYFGVSPQQEANSAQPAYDIGSGFNSAAASLTAMYDVNEDWSLLGTARMGRLIGDAADSPVVQDKNQNSVAVGVVRRMNFGF